MSIVSDGRNKDCRDCGNSECKPLYEQTLSVSVEQTIGDYVVAPTRTSDPQSEMKEKNATAALVQPWILILSSVAVFCHSDMSFTIPTNLGKLDYSSTAFGNNFVVSKMDCHRTDNLNKKQIKYKTERLRNLLTSSRATTVTRLNWCGFVYISYQRFRHVMNTGNAVILWRSTLATRSLMCVLHDHLTLPKSSILDKWHQ